MSDADAASESARVVRSFPWAPEKNGVREWALTVQEPALSVTSYPHVEEQWSKLHAGHAPIRKVRTAIEKLAKAQKALRAVRPTEAHAAEERVRLATERLTECKAALSAVQGQMRSLAEEAAALVMATKVFPITYYSRAGAQLEVLRCIEAGLKLDQVPRDKKSPYVIVSAANRQGADLCRWMFPNMFDVRRKDGGLTWFEQFQELHDADNDRIKQRLVQRLQCDGIPKSFSGMSGKVRGGKPQPTNFYPMAAQEIYRRWAPEGGVVWDMSCGFGGRMLGALTSSKRLTYIGTDPSTETMHNLERLGELIESVTGRRHSYELHATGSQDGIGVAGEVDFAFTSPPYWNLEWYETTDENQTLDDWFADYVVGTIDQVYLALKPGARYTINIADFHVMEEVARGGRTVQQQRRVNYVDRWVAESVKRGFRFIRQDSLEIQAAGRSVLQGEFNNLARLTLGHASGKKSEPLLHFYKPHTTAKEALSSDVRSELGADGHSR